MAGGLSNVANGALKPIIITTANDVDQTAGSATGGNGGGGGGGGGAQSDKEQFYQIYRAVCQVLGIPLNAKVAAMAYKTRQPGSGFLSLVKRYDKNYVKTQDFKNRASAYLAKVQEYMPWQKPDYKDMARFVRGDYSTDRIEHYLMGTKAFKAHYKYFRPGVDDPRTYLANEQALTRSLASANLGELTDRRKELYHKLDMSPDEVEQRIEELITGKDARDLMFGAGTQGTVNDYIFNTPGNMVRRQIVQQALKTQQGFNQSQVAGPSVQRDEQSRRITQSGL